MFFPICPYPNFQQINSNLPKVYLQSIEPFSTLNKDAKAEHILPPEYRLPILHHLDTGTDIHNPVTEPESCSAFDMG
ncbi:MAG: hypothetical protein KAX45_06985 [Chitinophagaceae bacterium]|nr:hypothetical protein [Chitinophagaceae bacterium]MBP8244265.1 hypothetical protein [Chitinophagaceae bacterium]